MNIVDPPAPRPLPPADSGYGACTPAFTWDLRDAPSNLVAVELAWFNMPIITRPPPETRFPVEITDDGYYPYANNALVPDGFHARWREVTVGDDPGYRVVLWYGDGASTRDLEAARQIVSSIRRDERAAHP
jgi:hypothetical protein